MKALIFISIQLSELHGTLRVKRPLRAGRVNIIEKKLKTIPK